MPARRILCLWFPRLGAERLLRMQRGLAVGPLATLTDSGNMQVLDALSAEAGWRTGPHDYWQVVTTRGARLWLFFAHGAELSPSWFCHGGFA